MRALLVLVLLALLVGVGSLFLARGSEPGTIGEQTHLFGLVDRISFEGTPGFRVYSHSLGGAERTLAPLVPDASLEIRGLEVPAGASLSFFLGSLEEGWEARPSFEFAVEADGIALFEKALQREDLKQGWVPHRIAPPAGTRTIRFRVRAGGSGKTLREAVLLGDPVLVTPGRRVRVPSATRGTVVVLADTMRADRLSLTGYRRSTTPSLDGFAQGAARFRNALSPSSWTKPAVASFFTGLSPARHGATSPFASLPPSTPTLAEAFRAAGHRTAAFVNNRLISLPEFHFDRGFDDFLGLDERAGAMFDLALAWIEAHLDAPFFLYVHLFDPHEPYDPPVPFGKRFVDEVVPQGLPASVPAEIQRALAEALYDGEVAYLDVCFRRFLERLARFGLAGRTRIAFLSDHGEEFGEHGGTLHGHTVYDELLRIPLLLGGAGLHPADVEEPVTIEDLFPTLARFAGAAVPKGLDGRDLGLAIRRARRGEGPGPERAFFHETEHFQRRAFAVRLGRWKYLEQVRLDGGSGGAELYDLSADPGEKTNLLDRQGERASELGRLLAAYRGATGRDTWHLAFRARESGIEFSGRIDAAGGFEEPRIESGGGEQAPPEVRRDGDALFFRIRAGGTTAGISFRTRDPKARVRVSVGAAGRTIPAASVRLGPGDRRGPDPTLELAPGEADSSDFLLDPAPRIGQGEEVACRLWRFAPPEVRPEDLPPEEVERLKALGYLRAR